MEKTRLGSDPLEWIRETENTWRIGETWRNRYGSKT